MAEEDAEIALLHQMQAGQESVAWDDGAYEPARVVISSNTENSDQVKQNFSDDQASRALSPSVTGVSPDDDTYDPLSPPPLPAAVLTPALLDSRSSSRASARRPKTIGSFIADDSDDEDEASPQNTMAAAPSISRTLLYPPTGDGPSQPLSRSPLHISSTSKEHGSTSVQNNPAAFPPASDQASLVDLVDKHKAQNISIPKPSPVSSSVPAAGLNVPKARLPHDRVGILEDRIKEDPRGDLDAWLSLISEHRKRNKLDDARAVYERFFKVFPSAVSYS